MAASTERHVQLDGINYYTLLEGSGNSDKDAPIVLLVHALMSNLHMYDATVKALHQHGYRTLRYDHVGHNKTLPPPEGVSLHIDDITRHAHALVEAVTGQSHVKAVIGCSIGGTIAWRYAMLFPKDVDRIIALASPGIKSPEVAHKLWSQRIEMFEEDLRNGTDKLYHQTVDRWFPNGRPEDDVVRRECLQHVKTCDIRGYKILADAIRSYDYEAEVAEIGKVKTLVVAGEEDQAGRADVLEEVSKQIPGAEFVVMKRTGHLPPMHKPEEFNQLMLRFLGEQ